jgi:hypothetical protein
MAFQQFETEVVAMRHLMVSLQTVLLCMENEGATPELSSAAVFLADELQNQLARVYEAARRFSAPANDDERQELYTVEDAP